MRDRVGSTNPTAEQLADLQSRVEALVRDSKSFAVSLDSEERQRTTKFRPGGDGIVELVSKLAQKHNVSLPGATPDGIVADFALAKKVRPLATEARAYANLLDDTALQAESECWWGTTALYTTLVRISSTDPQLADALRPAIDFFAHGRRKKTEEKK